MTEVTRTLRVGGLTPLTSVDYPGELAAVVFCQGCPWRCRYCHNASLLDSSAATEYAWSTILEFLERRVGLLDAVVFSGGEPLAQGAIETAIHDARELGYLVGLHTSGAYPERLRTVLPQVDWVGLDVKALPEDYLQITGVPGSGARAWESLEIALQGSADLEVRTTPMPGLDGAPYLNRLMNALADRGVEHYVLQRCRAERGLDPNLPLSVLPELSGQRFDSFQVRP